MSNISVDDVVVDETNGNAIFTVRLDVPDVAPVTVSYNNSNMTALNGSDYTFISGSLTFAPGEIVKTISVAILNDATVESLENFSLNLFSPSANAKIADDTAIASIVDNDAPSGVPVVSINDFVVDEANKEASFVITLNRPSTSVVSMNYATQNGTAVAGSDFTATSGSLNFAPGETAKTVKVSLLNDSAFEPSEAFNMVLSAIANATTLDPVGTAIIGENDAAPVSTSNISVDDIVVDETQGFADFLVRLDAPNVNPVSVSYNNSNMTALNGSDYTFISGVLNFAAGEMVKTVRIPLFNDATVESLENFSLNLFSPSANAKIADDTAIASIVDNDAPSGVPVVSINDFVVDEANKEASFVITLNRPSTSVVSMNYATQNGTAVAGSDFTATSGSLNFAPGETAKTVKVSLLNDSAFEPSEAFNLVLSAIANATTLDPVGTAIIGENDAAPVSTSNISVDDIVVDETQGFADFLVRLDAPNVNPVSVSYNNSNMTALNGSDYTFISGVLNFAAGEMVKTVRIPLFNDATVESLENFSLNLFSPSANAKIADDTAIASIVDNDAPSGVPVVSINDFVVDEANKEASFVITLNRPSTSVVSMNYATQNGMAVAGSDFTATSGSLNFAPGETAKTVKVSLLNDSAFEPSEAFNLVLSAIANATTLDPVGTAIIGENDAAPVSTSNISVDDIVVDETQGFADFLVRLDAPNVNPVSVSYNNSNMTALNGSDYTFISGVLNFAAGEMVKTVRIPLFNDATVESLENFSLNLFSPSANAKIADDTAIATIVDNDATTGAPAASITDAFVDEANQIVSVTVVLNKPSTGSVTLNVAGQNVTAADGSDFRSFPFGKISFAPGETAKTIKFGLLNDSVSESAELFDVVISGPVGATISDSRAHVVIAGNDAATVASPVINVANVTTSENKGYIDFLVTLSAPGSNLVTVSYNNSNGTALNGQDYNFQSGTLNFAAGEVAKIVRIPLIDDIAAEAQEAFTLNLFSPLNATIGNASATATIIDNDSPAPAAPIAITGTTGNDVLKGTQFADAITGNAGNDVLDGDVGNDSYNGGAGNDIYILEQTGDTYTEGAGGGTDLVISYLSTHSLGANVENLQLAGTAATGIGNGLANTITGNSAANTIIGGLGNDILNGNAGSDTVSYSTATAGVTVNLSLAGLQNTVGAGSDTLSNFENITGSNLNDTLTGNGSGNTLIGGLGNDVLNGGAGTDTVSYSTASAAVTVNLGLAAQQNTGSAGLDTLSNFENLTGGNFNDTLRGNTGNNTITGGSGDDNINGDAGNDILFGKAGNDTLIGGLGSDTFVFDAALNALTNNDVITDFNVVDDTIRLENAIFTKFTTTGAIAADRFVSGAGAVALDANDFLAYDTNDGSLYYDADGNGAGARVEVVSLTGIPPLTAADFIVS